MKANGIIKDLISKLLVEQLTDKEHQELLASDEVKAMMFHQWEDTSDIKVKTETPDFRKIFNRITAGNEKELQRYNISEIQKYKNKYRKLRRAYLFFSRIAAALLIALLTITGIYLTNSAREKAYSEVIAPSGQKSKVILKDGTIAWLNSGSTIRYSGKFNKRNREIELTGEAYFDVFENKRLPFIVNSADICVEALGTKFNLMAYPEDKTVQTTLVEGKVKICTKDAKTVILSPNQKAIYDKLTSNFSVEPTDPIFSVSWKDNMLKFDDMPLPDILTHLERWYDVEFYYPEKVLESERFTMTIKTESLREVLELIKISTPMKFEIKVDSVYIALLKNNNY